MSVMMNDTAPIAAPIANTSQNTAAIAFRASSWRRTQRVMTGTLAPFFVRVHRKHSA